MATETETSSAPVSSSSWRSSFENFRRGRRRRNDNGRLDAGALGAEDAGGVPLLPGRGSLTRIDDGRQAGRSKQKGFVDLRTRSAKMIGEVQLPPLQPPLAPERKEPGTAHQGWFRRTSTRHLRPQESEVTPDVPLVARMSDIWLPNKEAYSQAGMDPTLCILPSEVLPPWDQIQGDALESPWLQTPRVCEECKREEAASSQQRVTLQTRVADGRIRVHLEVLCRHKLERALPKLLATYPSDGLQAGTKVQTTLGWLMQWFTLCAHPQVRV